MKLLPPTDLRQIENHLAASADRLLSARGLETLRECVAGHIRAGGKRIRPQLVVWTARLTGQPDISPALLDLAVAWELFHSFLLIHDDIIDGSDSRRDQPALHVSLAALDSNCPRFGMNLAIVAGDLLFTASMRLLHELDVDAATHRQLLRLFSRVSATTGFGQAIDIFASHMPMDQVDEQTLLREYHWKTAAYTFEGPMLSGAILTGLDEQARSAISTFALSLGQAYQLQNDLIDLSAPAHEGCDLVQGKRTVTIVRYRATLPEPRRTQLDNRLHAITTGNGRAVDLAESLRRDMLADCAALDTSLLVRRLLDDATRAAADPALPAPLAEGMAELLAVLGRTYFTADHHPAR